MTTAILLAAGSSNRMGTKNKLLLSISGTPLVTIAAQALLASEIDQIIAVVGYQSQYTEAILTELSIETVYNPDHKLGMVSSIKKGLSAIPHGTSRIIIALGDMPLISKSHINALLSFSNEQESGSIIRPYSYNHEFGHPVIFDTRYIEAIMNCSDAHSLKSIVKANKNSFVPFKTEDRAYFTDMDTPSEYEKLNT